MTHCYTARRLNSIGVVGLLKYIVFAYDTQCVVRACVRLDLNRCNNGSVERATQARGSYRSGGLTAAADIHSTTYFGHFDPNTTFAEGRWEGGGVREDSTSAGGICLGVYEVHRICLDNLGLRWL